MPKLTNKEREQLKQDINNNAISKDDAKKKYGLSDRQINRYFGDTGTETQTETEEPTTEEPKTEDTNDEHEETQRESEEKIRYMCTCGATVTYRQKYCHICGGELEW